MIEEGRGMSRKGVGSQKMRICIDKVVSYPRKSERMPERSTVCVNEVKQKQDVKYECSSSRETNCSCGRAQEKNCCCWGIKRSFCQKKILGLGN